MGKHALNGYGCNTWVSTEPSASHAAISNADEPLDPILSRVGGEPPGLPLLMMFEITHRTYDSRRPPEGYAREGHQDPRSAVAIGWDSLVVRPAPIGPLPQ